jgi:hypothetical protein
VGRKRKFRVDVESVFDDSWMSFDELSIHFQFDACELKAAWDRLGGSLRGS